MSNEQNDTAEALQELGIMAGQRALFPEDRDPQGVYVDESEIIVLSDKLRCRLLGHKTETDPTLIPRSKQQMVDSGQIPESKPQIGETTWCRRCAKVLKHELNNGGVITPHGDGT